MKLSKVGQAFIAGLLVHAREYTAITNQWVNSYKRLFPQTLPNRITESPAYVCWGHTNRSALVRVPAYGKPNSARVEVRSLDSASNPYLAYAVMLGAGLRGIEQGYELPPGAEDDVWALTDGERRAAGYESLPENLSQAVDAMAGSELVAEILGEHVFDFFLKNKRTEWEEYRRVVTPSSASATWGSCRSAEALGLDASGVVAERHHDVRDRLHEAGRPAHVDRRREVGRPRVRVDVGDADPGAADPGVDVFDVEAAVVAGPLPQLVGVDDVLRGAHRVEQPERGPDPVLGPRPDHRHQRHDPGAARDELDRRRVGGPPHEPAADRPAQLNGLADVVNIR
ncbi:hypothetical protein GCM10027610_099340 [Dactylosporangium cerinum]